MLRKIIPIVLIVALVAGAAGVYLFKVNSAHFETSETTVVTVTEAENANGVFFVDAGSNPVPGVVCNVCDETTCTMLTSDELGQVQLPGEDYPYEVQVLTVPDGFAPPTEPITLTAKIPMIVCRLEAE